MLSFIFCAVSGEGGVRCHTVCYVGVMCYILCYVSRVRLTVLHSVICEKTECS